MRTDETGGGILGVEGDDQDKGSVLDLDLSEDGGEDDLSGDDHQDEGSCTELDLLSENGGEGDLSASVSFDKAQDSFSSANPSPFTFSFHSLFHSAKSSFSSAYSSSSTDSFFRTDSCSLTPLRHIGRDVEQIPSTRHFHYIFGDSYEEHLQPAAATAWAIKVGQDTLADFKRECGVNEAKDLDVLLQVQIQIRSRLHSEHKKINNYTNRAVPDILYDLKIMECEIDDLLDEFYYAALRQYVEGSRPLRKPDKMKTLLSSVAGKKLLTKITKEVTHQNHQLRERIQEYNYRYPVLIESHNPIGLRAPPWSLDLSYRHESTSLVNKSYVFGRKDEVEQIVQILLSLDSARGCYQPDDSLFTLSSKSSSSCSSFSSSFAADDNTLQVLPIVGLPGIGKTTLAQLVYNDDRVEQHFEILMWVCVSNISDGSCLTRKIIEECGISQPVLTADSLNLDIIRTMFDGKRFLLVLDDLCNHDLLPYWKRLLVPVLLRGDRGSAVVVTSRYDFVAEALGTLNPVRLQGLFSCDDIKQLLFRWATIPNSKSPYYISEDLCRKVIEKTKGVPLAIKTLGNILSSNAVEDWEQILEDDILRQFHGNLLPNFKVSYKDLPSHLKTCFAYSSLFPEGYQFDKLKLIKLWMAQDFIQPQGSTDRMEDEGSSYFDELLNRGYFQKVGSHYIINTLYNYLPRHIYNEWNVRITDKKSFYRFEKRKLLHLSLSCPEVKVTHIMEKVSISFQSNIMRSFIFNSEFSTTADYNNDPLKLPDSFFEVFKCLRVLDLNGTDLVVLPESVGSLIHLRFLDLCQTLIEALPYSLSVLYSLQCLEVKDCSCLKKLSKGLQNLISLRHLNASDDLINTLPGIGKLSFLQELKLFNVSKEEGHTIQELENLNEIRDKLWIQNIENVATNQEAIQANLQNKKYLNELVLEWSVNYTGSEINEAESTKLQLLQPPSNLQILSIIGNSSSQAPIWMNNSSVIDLRSISLRNCRNWISLPSLGALPYLQHLEIEYLSGVEEVGSQFYSYGTAFPSLRTLEFRHMHSLKKWESPTSSCKVVFPCLEKLILEDCPQLESVIILPSSLKILKIDKCTKLVLEESKLHRCSHLVLTADDVEVGLPNLSCKDLEEVSQNMQVLTSLENLKIVPCPESKSLSDYGLPGTLNELQTEGRPLPQEECSSTGSEW